MFGTFILGIAAGWGAPYAEQRIKAVIESALSGERALEPVELRAYALAICLLGAAILAMIFAYPHAGALTLGALVGVMGPRLKEKWNASKTPDYDS